MKNYLQKPFEAFKLSNLLVNNNLCEKSFSSLESSIIFDERLKVILVPLFIADFNLLNWELENFTFNGLYWLILH